MKRWHEERHRTLRRWREHRQIHVDRQRDFGYGDWFFQRPFGADLSEVGCACGDQPGRFRKRHARGCGRSRCGSCRRGKYPRRTPTRQERRNQQRFIEDLIDLTGGAEREE